jgi:hypothetical protein
VRTFEREHEGSVVLRLAEGCTRQPPGAVADSRTLQLTPESGPGRAAA